MNLAPGERLHCNIYIVHAGTGNFEHGCRSEARTAMAVILNLDLRIFCLDAAGEFGKEGRTSYACHILETDFIGTILHQVVNNTHIVVDRMYR